MTEIHMKGKIAILLRDIFLDNFLKELFDYVGAAFIHYVDCSSAFLYSRRPCIWKISLEKVRASIINVLRRCFRCTDESPLFYRNA